DPALAPVGTFEDAGGTEGERSVAQVAGAGVDDVGIRRLDVDLADGDAGDVGLVGHVAPGRARMTAVRGLPQAAPVRGGEYGVVSVSVRPARIDCDHVDAPGHDDPAHAVQGLRPEEGPGGRVERQRRYRGARGALFTGRHTRADGQILHLRPGVPVRTEVHRGIG